MGTVYLNGQYLPESEAHVSVFDRGFLFADSIYEVLPAYRNKLFRFDEHFQRLQHSLKAIGIANPLTQNELASLCQKLIKHNPECGQHVAIYLQITRGVDTGRQHTFDSELSPTIFASISPLLHKAITDIQPAQVVTCPDIRWGRCDIKANILLPNILARQHAQQMGADEALLVRDNQDVFEAASSNVFMVKDDMIITAPKGHYMLGGITRDLVVELLEQQNLPLTQRPIALPELLQADEVWLTSTNRQIQPVIGIDDCQINHGKTGPIWHNVIQLFYEYMQSLL